MKKIFLLAVVFIFSNVWKSKAQCEYIITSQVGNTVSFQHNWAVVGIMTIDSVFFDYGDATSQMFYASPPPGGIPSNSTHTYPGPGTYVTCLTRFMSSLGNPGVPIICTYCDTIVIPPIVGSCFVTSDFDINSIVGNTVDFVNLSSCSICTSLFTSWDYGDGSPLSSTYQGPHTYANPGTYTVCLYMTGTNPNGVTCIDTFCDVITVGAQPCNITPNYNISVAGNTATFTNLTICPTCTFINYDWDFGDGSPISNTISPVHAYTLAGTYYPCLDIIGLDATGNVCFASLCDTVVITVSACPANANFAASGSGLTKSFFNSSSCVGCTGGNTWLWNFGDGNTSSLLNPVHTYAAGGTYNVCLTITSTFGGAPCIDSFCTPIIVTSPGCITVADFTSSSAGLIANFTNNTGSCTNCSSSTYSWNFGDGSPTSSLVNPSHTYAVAGTYIVCLTRNSVSTTGLNCSDTFCAPITVLDPGQCQATSNFSYTSNLLDATFINNSSCTNCVTTTYSWNFGDGSPLSNVAAPVHTYSISGTYNVCLTVSGTSITGNTCTHTLCLPVTVQIPIGCASDAIFSSNTSGNTVAFLNASTCSTCTSTSYLWKFGDGATSTWNSPTHSYLTNGVFNVCLYVTGYASNQTICKDSLCKQIGLNSLGLNDIDKKQLSIFPNPTTKNVVVALPINEDLLELQLMDVTGRRLKTIKLGSLTNKELEIDLSNYTSGLYLIQVTTKQYSYKGQIIKQ